MIDWVGDFLVLIMLPIPKLWLELIRLSELPAGGLCVAGTFGFCVLTILPIPDPMLAPLEDNGFLLTGLELIRLLTLPTDDFCVSGSLDFCILITLPMRVLILELIRLLELGFSLREGPTGGFCGAEKSGFVVAIGLAMREVMLEFIRLWVLPKGGPSEFTIGCLAMPGFAILGCLMPRGPLEGLSPPATSGVVRSEEEVPGRMVEGRLIVIFPG